MLNDCVHLEQCSIITDVTVGVESNMSDFNCVSWAKRRNQKVLLPVTVFEIALLRELK